MPNIHRSNNRSSFNNQSSENRSGTSKKKSNKRNKRKKSEAVQPVADQNYLAPTSGSSHHVRRMDDQSLYLGYQTPLHTRRSKKSDDIQPKSRPYHPFLPPINSNRNQPKTTANQYEDLPPYLVLPPINSNRNQSKTTANQSLSKANQNTKQKESQSKSDDKKFYTKLGVGTTMTLGAVGGAFGWLLKPRELGTFQPELGKTEAEEYELFDQLMDPYNVKDADGIHILSEAQRHKALLRLMQDRIHANITYGLDKDSEGVEDYTATPSDIYEDGGKNIDCEDYSVLCARWTAIAKSEGLIPEDVKTYALFVNTPDGNSGHSIFVYEVPGDPPERYVIDTFTNADNKKSIMKDLLDDGPEMDSNEDGIISLNEYFEDTDFIIPTTNGQAYDLVYDSTNPGKVASTLVDVNKFIEGTADTNTVGDSISNKDLISIQKNWIKEHGKPSIPDDFDADSYQNELTLITAQQILGRRHHDLDIGGRQDVLTADDLGLTTEQKVALIGRFSQHYGRPFTAEDIALGDNGQVQNDVLVEMAGAMASQDSPDIAETLKDTVLDNVESLTDIGSIGASMAGGLVEGVLLTAFAQRKLNKIKRRKEAIEQSFNARSHREKPLMKQLAVMPPIPSATEEARNLAALQEVLHCHEKKMPLNHFHNLIHSIEEIAGIPRREFYLTEDIVNMGLSRKVLNKEECIVSLNVEKMYDYMRSHGLKFPNLLQLEASNQQALDEKQFDRFAELCFLDKNTSMNVEGAESSKEAMVNIFKYKDQYVDSKQIKQCLRSVHRLDTDLNLMNDQDKKILESSIKEIDKKEFLEDRTKIDHLNQVLKKLGIKLMYQTDKLGGSFKYLHNNHYMRNAKAHMHQLSVNTKFMYEKLAEANCVPNVNDVDNMLYKHNKAISLLYHLRGYDDRKLLHHSERRNTRLISAALSFLPIAPDAAKSRAYHLDVKYNNANHKRLDERIKHTRASLEGIKKQEALKVGWQEQEISDFMQLLDNVQRLKGGHMSIKENSATANAIFHGVKAAVSAATDLVPFGGQAVSGVTVIAKGAIAGKAAYDRRKGDKKLRSEGVYSDVKSVYSFLKQLYLQALERNQGEKCHSVFLKARELFAIDDQQVFEALLQTDLVESGKVKLNISQI